MARLVKPVENIAWRVWEDDEGKYSDEAVQRMILMDIRRELQTLNRLLYCHNFRRIPDVLDAIEANTKKPKPRAKNKKG